MDLPANKGQEGAPLLPQHAALVAGSAISGEVVSARGYRSVESRAELRRLGFGERQCQVPALLIPIWGVDGQVGNYQIRPDVPRVDKRSKDGKTRVIKYETVQGSTMMLDVPPPARVHISDPHRPLFITEGARKADSAVSAGLCCIALLGVWNWRGTNEAGGKVALPDWESVALNGRAVYLAFDSDVVTNPTVSGALRRLRSFLASHDARVRVLYLPPGPGGTKVGLDDYFAADHTPQDLLLLARDDLPQLGPNSSMAEVLEKVDSLLETKGGVLDAAVVATLAQDLARLSGAEYLTVRAAIKGRLGKQLNLNDFERVVSEERRKAKRPQVSEETSHRPLIVVSNRPLRDVSNEALGAIEAANDPPSFFVRSGALSRVRLDEKGRPIIDAVDTAMMRGRLTRVADFVKRSGEVENHVTPPLEVAQDIMAIGSWSFPALEAVVEAPALRPDGTVLDEPGYDAATGLVYMPSSALVLAPVPADPSDQEIADALALVEDAIGEFPYARDGALEDGKGKRSASRANALALLLTPVLRPAIAGPVPLALVDAPKAGTGKSLFAEIVALISTGRAAAMMSAPTDEEEWRKVLTSLLVEGSTIVVVDNVEGKLQSAALASVLTGLSYTDRPLGKTARVTVPQRATWIANGNNVRLGGDMPRRTYWIRLDSLEARPWERTGFRHPALRPWVEKHRGQLLAALLTMARAWFARGRPRVNIRVLGSYEEWVQIVGGVLSVVGVTGFLENLAQLYEQADDDGTEWDNWIRLWHDILGPTPITVATLLEKIEAHSILKDTMPDALGTVPSDEKDMGKFKVRLGKALRKRADAVFGSYRLECAGADSDSGVKRWRVVNLSGGSGGSGGDSFPTHSEDTHRMGVCESYREEGPDPRNPRTPGNLQETLDLGSAPEEVGTDDETEEWRF